MRDYQKIEIWKNVQASDWNNWLWQERNTITTIENLQKVIELSDSEINGIKEACKYLKMRITPHVACLMEPNNSQDVIRKQFVPTINETFSADDTDLFSDVNADERYTEVKGLVHRYPTKVLIFPTNYCGAYCRYCFRRKLNREAETSLNTKELQNIFTYIRENAKINEVILSGGDPLVLDDNKLEYILSELSKIPHVRFIRVHTKMLITNPYRITNGFIDVISKFKNRFPIFFIIHCDTIEEFSNPMRIAIDKLVDNGFLCFASCPLLKGINDDEGKLKNLWTELLFMRVKPYYLFHSDPVKGLKHFMVPMKRGVEIMRNLYDRISGLSIPLYCFNIPDGGGHALIDYNNIQEISANKYLLHNFEGKEYIYNEPDFL